MFIFINSSRTSCQVQATRWVSPTLPYLTPTFFIKSIFVGHRIIQCNQLTLQQQINIRFLKGKGMTLRGKPLSDHRINRCRMYNIRPFGSGKCRQKKQFCIIICIIPCPSSSFRASKHPRAFHNLASERRPPILASRLR